MQQFSPLYTSIYPVFKLLYPSLLLLPFVIIAIIIIIVWNFYRRIKRLINVCFQYCKILCWLHTRKTNCVAEKLKLEQQRTYRRERKTKTRQKEISKKKLIRKFILKKEQKTNFNSKKDWFLIFYGYKFKATLEKNKFG